MKRAILSLLCAILLSWAVLNMLYFLGPEGIFTQVVFALIPLLAVTIYYGHSRQALSREQNELLREQNELLRGNQPQEEAQKGGEKGLEETLKEALPPPTESASK